MRLFELLRVFAFALLALCSLPAIAEAQTDLSGLWTGRSSGNQVTIEMRSGGFTIMVAGQRREGQYGDGQFFRDAGSGLYLYTKPDGNNVRAQVIGADSLQVSNPDGWTDVFTRPSMAVASRPPAPVSPVARLASPNSSQVRAGSEPPERKAAAITDFRRTCSHLGDAQSLAHYEANVFLEGRFDENGRPYSAQYWQDKLDDGTVVSPYQCTLQVLQRHTVSGVPGFDDAGSAAAPGSSDQTAQYGTAAAPGGGTLGPLSAGGPQAKPVQEGLDARVIASDGTSAMDCVQLVELTKADSSTSGGGRVLSNQCEVAVEITWCYVDTECTNGLGAMWTVAAGRSWPVSAEREIRWAACRGANTVAFEKGSAGLRFICSAPAK